MARLYRALVFCSTSTCLLVGSSRADGLLRTSVNVGYEPALAADVGGHGWVLVRADREGALPRGARLTVEYNTDTLRLTLDRARFDRVELGIGIVGEALLAGVLTDYWRDGRTQGGRGLAASYVGAIGGAKVDLAPHYLEVTAGARRWFFGRWTGTSPDLVLPPSAWVGELRMRYTYWKIASDPSTYEPQRLFWRVRGVGFGLEGSADLRSDARAWGAIDPSFSPADPRNHPSRVVVGAHQWLRVGWQVASRIRLQAREEAHFMYGADDLDRQRIGGMNAYVVPLAGAPWPAYLSGKLLALEGSLHVRVKGQHELGALVDGVLTEDIRRLGASEPRWLAGVGVFADLRFGGFQVDLRAGWSPTTQPGTIRGSGTLLAAFGWGGVRAR